MNEYRIVDFKNAKVHGPYMSGHLVAQEINIATCSTWNRMGTFEVLKTVYGEVTAETPCPVTVIATDEFKFIFKSWRFSPKE